MMHPKTILQNFNKAPFIDRVINVVLFLNMGKECFKIIWICIKSPECTHIIR